MRTYGLTFFLIFLVYVHPVWADSDQGSPQNNSQVEIDQKIQDAQTKLMGNPHMMAEIQDMIKDPQLMQLLSDPGLTQAVMSHDVKAIQNNPKAQQLMNNPKMRALMDEMRNSSSSQSQ